MMRVLVMRHGAAASSAMLPDAHRHLTLAGRDECRQVAQLVVTDGVTVDRILCSPLVRAVQTAEIVAQVLGVPGAIRAHDALSPNTTTAAATSVLDHVDDRETVLLASHEPTVRLITAFLLQASVPPFATGEVALLERTDDVSRLVRRYLP